MFTVLLAWIGVEYDVEFFALHALVFALDVFVILAMNDIFTRESSK